ncbi:MAG: hypothetical protein K2V71_02855 [Methylotenera sp.]|nr:hypothetical protein [Methylotenera sp.]
MNMLGKVMQLINCVDVMIDNLNIFNFSLGIDADLDAVTISESLSTLEA